MNLEDARYDHPRLYWTALLTIMVGASAGVFSLLPRSPFFEAIGVTGVQDKVHALKSAVYWYSRSAIHASSEDLAFDTRYGNVVRAEAGAVIASLPDGAQFREVRIVLADVVIDSDALADRVIQANRFKDARFEIYDMEKSVVWIERKPLNVTLIEVGAARPDPDPPTNIVDLAFASYYWNQVKGEQ